MTVAGALDEGLRIVHENYRELVKAALLISIGSAVVTEMLNPVMNSDVDVRHHLGLPVLAEIPLGGIETGNGGVVGGFRGPDRPGDVGDRAEVG